MIAIGFPLIYRQEAGLLARLGELVKPFGQRPYVIADAFVRERYGDTVRASIEAAGLTMAFDEFAGECSPQAIDDAAAGLRSGSHDCIIGLGGGKAIDTAKAVKIQTSVPVIIMPTIASNDSPTSRLAITYEQDGRFIGPRFMATNPEAVFVDSDVILQAPVRFFSAGIADALVTRFEAEQVVAAGKPNFFDARPTEAALCLARHCYDVIRAHGPDAVADVVAQRHSLAVEKVTEANILLSGIGFEGCGVAGAHAIGMALSLLPDAKGILHGEEVAIGLLAQLYLEGRDDAFMDDMLDFYGKVRLPRSFAEIGLAKPSEADLRRVADFAARPGSRVHNMNRPVDADDVLRALHDVIERGQGYPALHRMPA
ncbi:glycerol dehydrogenase [Paracoccus sp. Z330]|uniref:Glycerol dehydrogenase n=1 Tax=Paracoccus onchidii TaxID=3017813 RepID=A0ABT4ZD58_9RHOB|nr:glycerol dehydrogenase [Paracoccus onchidii]MDB6177294.1 glycerol dehydrogenase [Paracoccus onchidii]